ncbi:LysM peptidoglycan-binding domain-containing protein [Aerococcaceae bacterium DSM 111020]|nr:LysM peptidoglycan-binding domain-containing protein [Aerococcaceae bacterium DSM 111020]
MSRERDNEYQNKEIEELKKNQQVDSDDEIVETKIDESSANEQKKEKKPWHKRFGSDENLRNRQYSRTSRNQPKQEASTLSKVLLGAFVVLLIIPFVVLLIVESQRSNDDIPARTKEQVMISRSSISSESESESSSSESSESVSSSGNISVAENGDESVGSQEISQPAQSTPETTQQPPAETTPAPAPTPAPETQPAQPSSTTHAVNAGETWYGIARTYGVNVYDLLAANGAAEGTPLHPGDVVVVP